MKRCGNPPSHVIVCTTSGGLDRTLRKQSKKLNIELDYCHIDEIPDKIQYIIADYKIVKTLQKLTKVKPSELIIATAQRIAKLEEDINFRYDDFDVIKDTLQHFIDYIRQVLYKTITVRERDENGKIRTVEKPYFTKETLRNGLREYKLRYGSKNDINVVVLIDDYMSDKQLTKPDSILQKLIVKRRHLGLSFIINLQRLVQGISKTIRSLVNTFILFKGVPTYDLEQVAQALGVPPREKNDFIDRYNQITNQYITKNGQKYYRKAIVSVEKQEMFMF